MSKGMKLEERSSDMSWKSDGSVTELFYPQPLFLKGLFLNNLIIFRIHTSTNVIKLVLSLISLYQLFCSVRLCGVVFLSYCWVFHVYILFLWGRDYEKWNVVDCYFTPVFWFFYFKLSPTDHFDISSLSSELKVNSCLTQLILETWVHDKHVSLLIICFVQLTDGWQD